MFFTFIRQFFASLMFLLAFSGTLAAKPNILLVIADDMGLDASPCHRVGNQRPRMPTLFGLCASGMVFDQAYTPPSCSPTRATIMTGKYGFRTGIGSAISGKRNPVILSTSETSLFDIFNDQLPDYSTAVIGKWHLTLPKKGFNHPAQLGVPYYFGIYSGIAKSYYNWRAVENGKTQRIEGYATTVLTDRAVKWVNEQDKPWFLWLAYNAPHKPYHAPPANLHTYAEVRAGEKPKKNQNRVYYNAALQALDTELGRLLDSMTPETRNNTIVIFIGDNGTPNDVVDQVYAHRGAKTTIFQGGINVPMIVSGPGIAVGRSQDLVTTTDLFATIASLAGATATTKDSIDITNAFRGQASNREFVYSEHFSVKKKKRGGVYGWAIRRRRRVSSF